MITPPVFAEKRVGKAAAEQISALKKSPIHRLEFCEKCTIETKRRTDSQNPETRKTETNMVKKREQSGYKAVTASLFRPLR